MKTVPRKTTRVFYCKAYLHAVQALLAVHRCRLFSFRGSCFSTGGAITRWTMRPVVYRLKECNHFFNREIIPNTTKFRMLHYFGEYMMNRLAVNLIVAFFLLLVVVLTLYGMKPSQNETDESEKNYAPPEISIFGKTVFVPEPQGASRLDRSAASRAMLHFIETLPSGHREYLFTTPADVDGPVTVRQFKQWKENRAAMLIKNIDGNEKPEFPEGFPRVNAEPVLGTESFVLDGGDYLTSRMEIQGKRFAGQAVSVSGLLGDRPFTLYVATTSENESSEDPMPLAVAWREAIRAANGVE